MLLASFVENFLLLLEYTMNSPNLVKLRLFRVLLLSAMFGSTAFAAESADIRIFGDRVPSAREVVEALTEQRERTGGPQRLKLRGVKPLFADTTTGGDGTHPSEATNDPPQSAPSRKALSLQLRFKLNSAHLDTVALTPVRVIGEALRWPELAHVRLLISGHTDASGSRDLNLRLSQRRAESVKWQLVRMGIDPRRLETVGRGPDEPLPATSDLDPANRRVQFTRVE